MSDARNERRFAEKQAKKARAKGGKDTRTFIPIEPEKMAQIQGALDSQRQAEREYAMASAEAQKRVAPYLARYGMAQIEVTKALDDANAGRPLPDPGLGFRWNLDRRLGGFCRMPEAPVPGAPKPPESPAKPETETPATPPEPT